jgi:putative hydrolase of the HAD superfamily
MRPPPGAHAEPDLAPVVATFFERTVGHTPSVEELQATSLAFRQASRRRLWAFDGAREALVALSSHYRIALVSNAQTLFTLPEITECGLDGLFDPLVISSDAGFRKPSPRIFEHALGLANARPDRTLHVGNDPLDDVVGGHGAGLRTCLVGPEARRAMANPAHLAHLEFQPDFCVPSVADLPARLLPAIAGRAIWT